MRERRSRSKTASLVRAPLLYCLLAVGIVFFVALGVKALKDRNADAETSTAPVTTDISAVQTSTSAQTVPTDTQTVPTDTQTAPNDTQTVPTDTQTVPTDTETFVSETTDAVTTVPETTEPVSQMTTVDDTYFSDALFIGDSRTDGLIAFSTPGACKHYCGTSQSIYKIMETTEEAYGFKGLRSLLQGMQFGKIYIMFGINECGYPTSSFAKKYREVYDEIRLYQPDALIYLQSICYVTQARENADSTFSTANIKEKNEVIKVLANNVDTFYLEVNDCLNDGTDHLPAEYTGDGVHLKASYYRLWHDYLLEHAVVNEAHPWDGQEAEGSSIEHP